MQELEFSHAWLACQQFYKSRIILEQLSDPNRTPEGKAFLHAEWLLLAGQRRSSREAL